MASIKPAWLAQAPARPHARHLPRAAMLPGDRDRYAARWPSLRGCAPSASPRGRSRQGNRRSTVSRLIASAALSSRASETAPLQYGGSVMIASTEAEACPTLIAGRRHQSYAGAGIPSHTTVMGCEPWGLSSSSPNAWRSSGTSRAMAEERSAITRERWMSGTTS
jgi:hypothetical protein